MAARAHSPNPARSPEQYRLAQAVLSGASTGMPVKVAREIVDKTPARLRSKFSKRNPDQLSVSRFYEFGYVAGEQDRKSGDVGLSVDPMREVAKRFDFIWDRALGNGEVKAGKKSDYSNRFQAGYYDAYSRRPRKKQKANPRAASDDMYESFHGEPSDETVVYQEEEHYHSNLAALGELVELKVKLVGSGTAVIGFEGDGEAVTNPKDKKRNPFWPFNSFTHTTIYHVDGTEYKAQGTHKGYKIYKEPTGSFVVPKLDAGSQFDTKKDAVRFIDSWVKNRNPKGKKKPVGPFRQSMDFVGSAVGALQAPLYDTVGFVDDKLARAMNPANRGHGPVMLATNEAGNQLFIVGGDQSLDLPGLGITGDMATKESIVIGDIKNIVYHTRKVFDGKPEEFDYTHKAGEDTGDLPTLRYDRVNCRLYIDGGAYKIERPLMDTSPGLEN